MRVLAAMLMMLSAASFAAPIATAQDDAVTVVARGLTTPGGFTWNANDVLFIALAGSGGSQTVQPEAPAPLGPLTTWRNRRGGRDRRRLPGCACHRRRFHPHPAQGRIYGAEAIAELDGQLYLLISNGGDQYGDHQLTEGVYRIGGDGALSLIADHAAFLQDNPPAVAPAEGLPNPGNPVAMVSGDGALWIADELNGLITRVTPAETKRWWPIFPRRVSRPAIWRLARMDRIYAVSMGQAEGSSSVVNDRGRWHRPNGLERIDHGQRDRHRQRRRALCDRTRPGVSDTAPNGAPASGRLVRQSGDCSRSSRTGSIIPPGSAPGRTARSISSRGPLAAPREPARSPLCAGRLCRRRRPGELRADCGDAGWIDDLPVAPQTANDTPQATTAPETPTPADTPTALPTPSPTVPWTPDSAAPTGEVIEVGLSEYVIDMPTKLAAGPVTFLITNYGSLTHSFAIEGAGNRRAAHPRARTG